MIYKIFSNHKNFKEVHFSVGLNLILADKKQESGKKDSRNGLGKTTLINIINFCLGADLAKCSLPLDKISDWVFYIELDIGPERIIASRAINNPNVVFVQGNHGKLPISPEVSQEKKYYKIEDWKQLLGISLFGLNNDETDKYMPTFRSLFAYFSRRNSDAYLDPFRVYKNQKAGSIQINNSFFCGLNWKYAAEAEEIKQTGVFIKNLTKSIDFGLSSSQGELEAERVGLEKTINQEHQALSTFQVLPQYQEFQEKANSLSKNIKNLLNDTFILNRKLERYEDSSKSEKPPAIQALEELYKEAGVCFGTHLRKSLDEAKTFHLTLVENRKKFLLSEITEIKNLIFSNEKKIENLSQERSEIMLILKSHGALEEFVNLQGKLTKKQQRLESVKQKIQEIKDLSDRKKEIKAKKIELETRLQRDYELSRPNWTRSIASFNENSQALYNESGSLIINISDTGYSFNVQIPRSSSEGVSKMKIFCYDLMLVDVFSLKRKINFLIHDSIIFDGVDSRQIALALEHANKKALENNFQYICTFNSDTLPSENFSKEFCVQNFVKLTLTDQDPSDSLLGFRYND